MDESSLGTGGFAVAIFAIMLFAFGLVTGEHVGEEMGGKCVERRDFHMANLRVVAAGVAASAVVWALELLTLAGLVLGLMAGALAGARMGFGESVGPWKFADKYLNVNRGQDSRTEAEQSRRRAVRKARKEGEREPELMSVQAGAPNTGGGTDAKKGSRN